MVKITSVEPQKKSADRRTKRFNIFLDGQFAFGADEDLVVERRLVVGKEIDPADLEKILFEAEVGKLMERVYGLFNIRIRSEKELRDYLKKLSFKRKVKGNEEISPIVVESTIDKAIEKGLINDKEFASAWVEARRKSKKKGIIALKQELFQKGIPRDIIEEVISHQSSVISEEQIAEEALQKKIRNWKNLPKLEFRKKASEFLMRKGFEYSVVRGIVENVLQKEYNNSSSDDSEENYDDF